MDYYNGQIDGTNDEKLTCDLGGAWTIGAVKMHFDIIKQGLTA